MELAPIAPAPCPCTCLDPASLAREPLQPSTPSRPLPHLLAHDHAEQRGLARSVAADDAHARAWGSGNRGPTGRRGSSGGRAGRRGYEAAARERTDREYKARRARRGAAAVQGACRAQKVTWQGTGQSGVRAASPGGMSKEASSMSRRSPNALRRLDTCGRRAGGRGVARQY
jgi:hypothetical protein